MKENLMKMLMLFILLAGFTAGASVLDQAKVYFPFEGDDTGISSEPWENKGTAGFGEVPYEVGTEGTHTPTVSGNGIKGQAFDASMMDYLSLENSYRWGEPNEPAPFDTDLEQGLIGTYSFTVTFWIQTEEVYGQGRILGTDNWQINYRGDFIELHFIEEGEFVGSWVKSSVDPRGYPSLSHWRFGAITYDGSTTPDDPNALKFYTGSEYIPVELDAQYERGGATDIDFGMLDTDSQIGCRFYIGNASPESNRPFIGFIDEVRIWTSQSDDSSGVLSLEELEMVRLHDTGQCDGAKLIGDVNGDCYVDLKDWSDLAYNWLSNNAKSL